MEPKKGFSSLRGLMVGGDSLRGGEGSMRGGEGSMRGGEGSMRGGEGSMRGGGSLRGIGSASAKGSEAASIAEKQPAVMMPHDDRLWRWNLFATAVALVVATVEPFRLAYADTPCIEPYSSFFSWELYLSTIVFTVDMGINMFLVAYVEPDTGLVVIDWPSIAKRYIGHKGMFWRDLLFTVPWDQIILAGRGLQNSDANEALHIGLLMMLRLGQMHRIMAFFDYVEARMLLSQMVLMLLRNYLILFFNTHWAACVMYYIARLELFEEGSWVGRASERFIGQPTWVKYVYTFYFTVSAYTGLGDAELYAASVAESVFLTIYFALNMVLAAYILGTVSMLMVMGDKRSKVFRDRMTNLQDFSLNNNVPKGLTDVMREHLELHFHSEQASDEHVLKFYPITIRRRVMRHLYLNCLKHCYLFRHTKAKFLDAVLAASHVELFLPSVQILSEGDIVNELLIVVEGEVESAQGNRMPMRMASKLEGSKRQSVFGGLLGKSNSHIASDDFSPPALGDNNKSANGHRVSNFGIGSSSQLRSPSLGADEFVPASKDAKGSAATNGLGSALASPLMAQLGGPISPAVTGGNFFDFSAHDGSLAAGNNFANALSPGGNMFAQRRESFSGSFSIHGGHEYANARNLQKLGESEALGDVAFFTEIPSPESVWSSSVVRVLVITKVAYEKLADNYPQQAHIMLDNLLQRAEEVTKMRIVEGLDALPGLDPTIIQQVGEYAFGNISVADMPPELLSTVTRLMDSEQQGRFQTAQKLRYVVKQHFVRVDQRRVYDFLNAASAGHVDTIKAMLQQGLSPNSCDYDKRTGLMLACHEGHEAVAKLLLESKADPAFKDNFGNTAMYEAVKQGHDSLVELLLKYKSALGVDGIMVAAQMCTCVFDGDLVMLRRILRSGADPDSADYDKRNALHIAASEGNLTAVKVMIEEGGATTDFADRWGATAMDEAVRVGAKPVIDYLTPLMELAKQGKIKSMRDPGAPTFAQLFPKTPLSGPPTSSSLTSSSRREGSSVTGRVVPAVVRGEEPTDIMASLHVVSSSASPAPLSKTSAERACSTSPRPPPVGAIPTALQMSMQHRALQRFGSLSNSSRELRSLGSYKAPPAVISSPRGSNRSSSTNPTLKDGKRSSLTGHGSISNTKEHAAIVAAAIADLHSMPPVLEGSDDDEVESSGPSRLASRISSRAGGHSPRPHPLSRFSASADRTPNATPQPVETAVTTTIESDVSLGGGAEPEESGQPGANGSSNISSVSVDSSSRPAQVPALILPSSIPSGRAGVGAMSRTGSMRATSNAGRTSYGGAGAMAQSSSTPTLSRMGSTRAASSLGGGAVPCAPSPGPNSSPLNSGSYTQLPKVEDIDEDDNQSLSSVRLHPPPSPGVMATISIDKKGPPPVRTPPPASDDLDDLIREVTRGGL